MNMNNYGTVEGRLTRDPKILENKDGSRKVKFTVAAQDNFKGPDGKRGTQFVNLDGFIRADKQGNGVYDSMHEGDLVKVHYTVKTNNYVDKDGNQVFGMVLQVQEIQLGESKNVTEKRAAQKAAGDAEPPVEAMDNTMPFES